MLDLVHFMLVRDARMRPTLADVQARLADVRSSIRAPLPPHVCSDAAPPSSRGGPGGLQPSGGSQLFSSTAYVPSPKATMPMPLLAALPLTGQLVLAPLALLGSTPALRQHPACRAVLLFGPAAACEPVHGSQEQRAAEAAGGGQSPASPGSASSASSSWDSSPGGSRRYYGASGGSPPRTTALTFAANPVFGPQDGCESPPPAGSPAVVQRLSVRGLTGTPRSRASLRFSSAAIHLEPAAGQAVAGGVTPSIRSVLLGSPAKVHPDSTDGLRGSGGGGDGRGDAANTQLQQQQADFGLPVPPLGGMPSAGAAAAAAEVAASPSAQHGTAATSGSSRRGPENRMLLAVLSDAELSTAAASCAAASVECRLAAAHPAERWWRQEEGGSRQGSSACGRRQRTVRWNRHKCGCCCCRWAEASGHQSGQGGCLSCCQGRRQKAVAEPDARWRPAPFDFHSPQSRSLILAIVIIRIHDPCNQSITALHRSHACSFSNLHPICRPYAAMHVMSCHKLRPMSCMRDAASPALQSCQNFAGACSATLLEPSTLVWSSWVDAALLSCAAIGGSTVHGERSPPCRWHAAL